MNDQNVHDIKITPLVCDVDIQVTDSAFMSLPMPKETEHNKHQMSNRYPENEHTQSMTNSSYLFTDGRPLSDRKVSELSKLNFITIYHQNDFEETFVFGAPFSGANHGIKHESFCLAHRQFFEQQKHLVVFMYCMRHTIVQQFQYHKFTIEILILSSYLSNEYVSRIIVLEQDFQQIVEEEWTATNAFLMVLDQMRETNRHLQFIIENKRLEITRIIVMWVKLYSKEIFLKHCGFNINNAKIFQVCLNLNQLCVPNNMDTKDTLLQHENLFERLRCVR